ncbi:tyrosinase family oxidase copper chaperone [Streptomyces sp. NPDC087300]|uniref:tyrosinase family oxidase copper chaperone n=1 Tax=Streptomyces sp. NPDC087300 TaxID=3365780 RepID=UPI003816DFE7
MAPQSTCEGRAAGRALAAPSVPAPLSPPLPDPETKRRPFVDRLSRRHLLGVAVTSLLGAAGIFRTARTGTESDAHPARDPLFDEMYRGRRIVGAPVAGRAAGAEGDWQVTVDGKPLGLMRRADGSYLSMVDHYQSHATPLAAARGAVDELGSHLSLSGRHH